METVGAEEEESGKERKEEKSRQLLSDRVIVWYGENTTRLKESCVVCLYLLVCVCVCVRVCVCV